MEDSKSQNDAGKARLGGAGAPLLAALFAVVGAIGGALVKGYFDGKTSAAAEQLRAESALAIQDRKATAEISLEQQKFQANLILKAIDTDDQAGAVKALTFFANAGLIPDFEAEVLAMAADAQGAAIPALRAPSEFLPVSEFSKERDISVQSRSVAQLRIGPQGVCTATLVQDVGLVFPDFCLHPEIRLDELRVLFDVLSSGIPDESLVKTAVTSITLPAAGLAVAQLEDQAVLGGRGIPLNSRPPRIGEPVFMISYPNGGPQKVSADCYVVEKRPTDVRYIDAEVFAYACQAEPGSAGGAVFAEEDGALLGVHAAKDEREEFRRYGILTAVLATAK